MIVYHSRFLTRGEVWFDNEPDSTPVDWIVYHQTPKPAPGSTWRLFHTLVIDLTQSAEVLLAQMDGFTASDIRKAEKKDRTSCLQLNAGDPKILADFEDFYDRFAVRKQLGPIDRAWIERTAETGKLDLWTAQNPEGATLVYHALYREGNRVRSLHLASLHSEAVEKEAQRKIGRASRCLSWNCMLHYQGQGVQVYDLGGWYNGTTDLARLGINKFKKGFGGQVICEYECQKIVTFKGRTVLTAARAFGKLKERRAAKVSTAQINPELTPALEGAE